MHMSLEISLAFASVLLVSLASLVGIGALSLSPRVLRTCVFALVSLAAGALFGDAIIHLIPKAFEGSASDVSVSLWILAGILTFFVLEQFLRWHHHHGADTEHTSESEVHPLGFLVLTADGLHNFIDGAIIAASYMVSIELGIATTIAVLLHELPQEIGDFALLLHAGFTSGRALLWNFVSGLIAFLGAGFVLVVGDTFGTPVPALLAIAAGSFLYIAGSDLVPELHKARTLKRSLIQFTMILVGVGIMYSLTFFEETESEHFDDAILYAQEVSDK
jgi:zinc and cadmium transporter